MSFHQIHKFYTKDLMLRVSVADSTEVVQKMHAVQKTFPIATIALGRTITGALLMASQLRQGQRVGIAFNGDGPLGTFFAEASFDGEARGYVPNPHVDLPLKNGKLDVAGGVGKGILTVTRNLPFQKQPHNGMVPIVSGEISQDLAYYLFQSHQVPSVVALSVHLDGDGSVLAAGGILLELMPGADETLIATLEKKSLSAPPLSKRLLAGQSPEELVKPYVHDSPLVHVEHPGKLEFVCKCSMERVERTMILSGRSALAEMVLKGDDVAVTCQFCGREYKMTIPEMRRILDSLD